MIEENEIDAAVKKIVKLYKPIFDRLNELWINTYCKLLKNNSFYTWEYIFWNRERNFSRKKSLLESLVENKQSLYGQPNPYLDMETKAAVLMEELIRWHIFVDGNKRTGLLATCLYLNNNNILMAVPLIA